MAFVYNILCIFGTNRAILLKESCKKLIIDNIMKKLNLLFTALLFLCCLPATAHDFYARGIYYNILSAYDKTVEVTFKGDEVGTLRNEYYTGSVVIPESVTAYDGTTYTVTSIGDEAFYRCYGLTSITIPKSITNIGNYAFGYCRGLKSIVIPNSVTNIGGKTFYECTSLASIEIPNSVTTIGEGAFRNCTNLTSIEIPNSVTSIGQYAFDYCTSLTSVEIPNSVTSIEYSVFNGCEGLTSIVIPNSVTTIGQSAFNGCKGLIEFNIPESVTEIDDNAFKGCTSLKKLYIENSKNTLHIGKTYYYGDRCLFFECPLETLYVGRNLYLTEDLNFRYKTNLSVTIDNNVTNIDFLRCENIIEFNIPESAKDFDRYDLISNGWWKNQPDGLIYKDSWLLGYKGEMPTGDIEIAEGTKRIINGAFGGCTGINSITLPNGVTTIGQSAFSGCTGLIEFNIPESVTDIGNSTFLNTGWWNNLPDGVIYKDNWLLGYKGEKPTGDIEIAEGTKRIINGAFQQCTDISSITLPNGVTTIGQSAFKDCTGLTSITIPSSVTKFERSAFYRSGALNIRNVHISDLSAWYNIEFESSDSNPLSGGNLYLNGELITNIEIPDTVTVINPYTFYSSRIQSVTIPKSVMAIGEGAFTYCTRNKLVINNSSLEITKGADSHGDIAHYANVVITEGKEEYIKDGDFYFHIESNELAYYAGNDTSITLPSDFKGKKYSIGATAFQHNENIKNVLIPNNVTSIGDYAFSYCTNLTSIEIPNSVTSIGNGAFAGCSSFTSIVIPSSVTNIGNNAFQYCTKLVNIEIPNSITRIGEYAFSYCTNLTSIEIPSSVTNIGNNAFQYCTKLVSIEIPNSVTGIGEYAFLNCTGLTSVVIGNSVTSIGGNAFYSCTGLTSIVIGSSVMNIGSYAFHNCTGLTSIEIPSSVTNIGSYAFNNCTGLTSIEIPSSVTNIGSYAFYNCTGLENVEIQYGLTSIGAVAFGQCSNIRNITIPESVTNIENSVFGYCTSLKNIELPNSVTTIPQKIFYCCYELSDVKIGNKVTSIENDAFVGCKNLQMIIPQSVTHIRRGAFGACSQAKLVVLHKMSIDGTIIPRTAHIYVPTTEIKDYYTSYSDSVKYIFTEDATTTATTLSLKINNNIPDILKDTDIRIEGYENAGDSIFITGLEPNKDYNLQYSAELESKNTIQGSITIKTDSLVFKTLKAKATSNTKAIICAEANIANEEAGTGFEWRRIDAPDLIPSEFAGCAVHEGVMEGALHNLSANTYYKYRPYYCSAAGNYYYGEWIGFGTADAYVYFTPTVHTYAATKKGMNSVCLNGYALAGSDNIKEQGFEYWPIGTIQAVSHIGDTHNAVTRVTASGQRMSAVIEDLEYGTLYACRAYMATENETFYGEEITFETSFPTGIADVYEKENEPSIQVQGNTIVVSGHKPSDRVQVYTMYGAVIYNGTADEDITLESGMYIVNIGNTTKKIRIK